MSDVDETKDIINILKSTLIVDNEKGIPFFAEKMDRYIQQRIDEAVENEKENIREFLIERDYELLADKI